MKRFAFYLLLTLCLGAISFAQESAATAKSRSETSAMLQGTAAINAQLENSLDVKKAKVGDEVILKTKKAIKENGQTVIQKGAILVGRVTEVQERTKGMAVSKIGVLFDTLRQNGESLPVMAMISSITRVSASANSNDDMFANASGSSTTRTETQSSSGGLLGGVGNTVGGVVNTSGGSTLSMTGNNLKLEKGTTFNLNINQSTSVSSSQNKVLGN